MHALPIVHPLFTVVLLCTFALQMDCLILDDIGIHVEI